MFPYWIGLNARTLVEINRFWLQSTASLLGLVICYSASSRTPFGCRQCVVPLDRIASSSGRWYYRCRSCGLLKLARAKTGHGVWSASAPERQVLRFTGRAALHRRFAGHRLN